MGFFIISYGVGVLFVFTFQRMVRSLWCRSLRFDFRFTMYLCCTDGFSVRDLSRRYFGFFKEDMCDVVSMSEADSILHPCFMDYSIKFSAYSLSRSIFFLSK